VQVHLRHHYVLFENLFRIVIQKMISRTEFLWITESSIF